MQRFTQSDGIKSSQVKAGEIRIKSVCLRLCTHALVLGERGENVLFNRLQRGVCEQYDEARKKKKINGEGEKK